MVAIDAIIVLLLIVGLAIIIYGPWQWICTDFARQYIFESRDALFDMASAGKLNFDSAEYKEIRLSMEQIIRYLHQITIPRILYLSIVMRNKKGGDLYGLSRSIEQIENLEAREEVQYHVKKMFQVISLSLVAKSPIAILLVFFLFLVMLVLQKLSFITEVLTQKIGRKVEEEAESADDIPRGAQV